MEAYRDNVLRIFTTPQELRDLADRMDRLWGNSRPGSDLVVAECGAPQMRVLILIDQDLMMRPAGTERPTPPDAPIAPHEE